MFTLTETDSRLELHYRMHTGQRIFFCLVAFFPLIAPYELLVKPGWESPWSLFFLFSLVISLGALAVSGIALLAGLAGMNISMAFDRQAQTFAYARSAPVFRPRPAVYPLSSIQSVQVDQRDWSDSAPSFVLTVNLTGDRRCSSNMSATRDEMEVYRRRVLAFLGRSDPE